MNFLLVLLIYGIPIILGLLGIAFLIRGTMKKPVYVNKKPTQITCTARVTDKLNYYGSGGHGALINSYYLVLQTSDDENIKFKVSKSLLKRVNYNDEVKVSYAGQRIIKLEVIKPSGNKTEIRSHMAKSWSDLT